MLQSPVQSPQSAGAGQDSSGRRQVAVGTRITPRPPHRSRRALLTHRAPPSGFGVEAVTWQRVYSSDWRKEAGDELDEPLPAEARRLAAPLERCEPEPLHLVEEPPQARVVTRDSEVVQMPFQHLFHPSAGFRDGVVCRALLTLTLLTSCLSPHSPDMLGI